MKSIRRRMTTALLGVVPLCVFALCAPTSRAGAYQFSIFSVLLGTITGPIGGALTNIQSAENALHTVTQTVAFPISIINAAHSFITTNNSRFAPYMNQVAGMQISAATLPTTQSFEGTLTSGGTASQSSYFSTFGPRLNTPSQQSNSVKQQQDMNDAVSLDAIDLAGRATSSANSTISLSNTMQSTASSVSPGDADLLSAQANASLLASIAIEHQLLAAQIRIEAATLADQSLNKKRTIASATGTPLPIDK